MSLLNVYSYIYIYIHLCIYNTYKIYIYIFSVICVQFLIHRQNYIENNNKEKKTNHCKNINQQLRHSIQNLILWLKSVKINGIENNIIKWHIRVIKIMLIQYDSKTGFIIDATQKKEKKPFKINTNINKTWFFYYLPLSQLI